MLVAYLCFWDVAYDLCIHDCEGSVKDTGNNRVAQCTCWKGLILGSLEQKLDGSRRMEVTVNYFYANSAYYHIFFINV